MRLARYLRGSLRQVDLAEILSEKYNRDICQGSISHFENDRNYLSLYTDGHPLLEIYCKYFNKNPLSFRMQAPYVAEAIGILFAKNYIKGTENSTDLRAATLWIKKRIAFLKDENPFISEESIYHCYYGFVNELRGHNDKIINDLLLS